MNQIVKEYSEYNYWANKRVSKWLQSIPMKILKTKMKSSYDSIYSTVQHILSTEKFWLSRITESKFEPPRKITEETEIFQAFENQSKVFNKAIQKIEEANLKRTIEMNLKAKGFHLKGKHSIEELIQHCINHSTYHRGQINN